MAYNILGGQLFFFLGSWVQLALCLCLAMSLLSHIRSCYKVAYVVALVPICCFLSQNKVVLCIMALRFSINHAGKV